MKSRTLKILILVLLCMLIISPAAAQTALSEKGPVESATIEYTPGGDSFTRKGFVYGEEKDATGTATYIIQLRADPLATYRGGVDGLSATSPAATGAAKLDVNTAASRAYRAYLADARAEALGVAAKTLGRTLTPIHVYDVAYNGFAVELSPAEALELSKLPAVHRVIRDFTRYIQTDTTPEFLNAVNIWNGNNVRTGVGTMGEGMLVGIIDTGINMDHPSFADVGGDGYDHSWTGDYRGWCNSTHPDYDATLVCNDKLVGVYSYPASGNNPEDDHSHGSHTASTSAGNILYNVDYNGFVFAQMSGMAPHANIISYDVCTPDSGCQGASILDAIDDAVTDAVDVINYSIGGGPTDPWNDADSEAYLNAREAGVFVATSAGNSGPGESTVGSPGNSPWMTTVANMTIARVLAHPVSVTGPGEVPAGLTNLAAMPGSGPAFGSDVAAGIVYSGDVDGTNITGCAAFPADSFDGAIALIQRGGCTFETKVNNADAAGAVAVIVFNNVAGPPIAMAGLETTTIPSAMLDLTDGSAVRDWVQAETDPTALIGSALARLLNPAWADIVASGSSRGPNVNADFIKPDIGAPGSNIFAAYAGDATSFGFMSGTSMASPHVAGAAALVRDIHPSWTPSMVESALMMTSERDGLFDSNATDPADPFDVGAGRLDLTNAALAGLTLDEDKAGFDAANPNNGGDPTQMNLASLANDNCLAECSWTRTFTVVSNMPAEYTITFEGDVPMTATPNVFNTTGSLSESKVVTFTADVSGLNAGEWYFGTVILTPVETGANAEEGVPTVTPELHMPIAVVPTAGVLPDLVRFETRRDAGSIMETGLQSIEITNLHVGAYGLVQANLDTFELMEDPTNDEWGDDLSQVFYTGYDVPAGAKRLVAEVTASEAPDVDLFVFQNGVGVVCASTTSSWEEYCNVENPAPGIYFVIVQNWAGSANQPDEITLASAVVPDSDAANFTAYGPAAVPQGDLFDLQLRWDEPAMTAGDRWYGTMALGTDAGSPGSVGEFPVDIIRLADDVAKNADVEIAMPGDTVNYEITVRENVYADNLSYRITDTIPAGLTYVPASVSASSGVVDVTGDTLTWEGVAPSALPGLIEVDYGGYFDISGFGSTYDLCIDLSISNCDEAYVGLTGIDFTYLGVQYDAVEIVSNGFVVPGDVDMLADPLWFNQDLPDTLTPNTVIAPWWADFDLDGSAPDDPGAGKWYLNFNLTDGTYDYVVVQWEGAELYGLPGETFTFQIWMVMGTDIIWFSYADMSGDATYATVGVENADGTVGSNYYYNGAGTVPSAANDLLVGYLPVPPITISYATTVDGGVAPGTLLTNAVQHQTDNPWSVEALAWDDVYIGMPGILFPQIRR